MSEYPLNENNQYPLIRKCVERMFASRTKPMSEKTIEIWVEEIITRNVSDLAIKKATKEFVEEEEYNLSLPIVLKLIYKYTTFAIQHDKECPFCEGRGTVIALGFETNGKLISSALYLLNCYCNKKKGNLQMKYDKSSFHKTFGKNKYFRVFKNIMDQYAYQERVWANNDMDILS